MKIYIEFVEDIQSDAHTRECIAILVSEDYIMADTPETPHEISHNFLNCHADVENEDEFYDLEIGLLQRLDELGVDYHDTGMSQDLE